MKIIQMEIRRLLQDITIWIFIIAAIAVNAGIVAGSLSYQDDITYINQTAGQLGAKMTEQSITQMQNSYDKNYEKIALSYETAMGIPPVQLEDIAKIASAETMVEQLTLLDQIIQSSQERMAGTTGFQTNRILHTKRSLDVPLLQNTDGWQADRLQRRVAEANENKEAQHLSSNLTPVREVLYARLLFAVYMELMIISAFIVLKSLGSDCIHHTQAVVYACKKGRALQKSKMCACLVIITGAFLLVAGASLLIYFAAFPQWNLMNSPASAGLYPDMITKFALSCWEYLFLNLVAGYLLTLMFAVIAGAFGMVITNAYIGMMAFMGSLTLMLLAGAEYGNSGSGLTGIFPLSNPLTMLVQINFFDKSILFNCSSWFLYQDGFPLFPFFELAALAFWFAVILLLYQCACKAFQRKDL